ncbi:MAG TPA: hypothetical protein VFX70_20015 [Mycobacteriales bacterium]|nr:hypothetical protein [Mycobacteriales bacterium]
MEPHGFDDPTANGHTMYSPDPAHAGTGMDAGAEAVGPDHDTVLDPDDGSGGQGGVLADPRAIELDVDGRASEVGATIDTDDDGRADTAVLDSTDGHRIVLTDSDHDGVADHALLVDGRGQVVDSATFDRATNHWHDRGVPGPSARTTGSDVAAGARSPGASGSAERIEVDAAGQHAQVDATIDTNHDGRPDTAIVNGGAAGTAAVTDTNADGRADEAALLDGDGHVAIVAHIDPHTGQWVGGDDGRGPYTVGESVPGADGLTTPASADEGSNRTSTTAEPPHGTPGQDRSITVDAGGRTSTIPATLDADNDGVNETAVVRGVDGTRVEFADTDGDGEADRATVIDPRGAVVGSARYDPVTAEWTDDLPTG